MISQVIAYCRTIFKKNMATMGSEVLVQMFKCCVADEPHHHHHHPGRRRIDRSMIGNPTDFRHTGHIGSADLMGAAEPKQQTQQTDPLTLLQSQMRSKGGYDTAVEITTATTSHIVNARSLDEIRRK